MAKLKRIGVLSFAVFRAIYSAIIGMIIGILYSITGIGGTLAMLFGIGRGLGGVMVIVVMTILFAIIGFIFGAIAALFYNITAKLTGGIEIEVEE